MGFWGAVLPVLRNSDCVLLVIDARIPVLAENKEIVKKAETMKKRLIKVYMKTDLVSQKKLRELEEKNPEAYFVSEKKKKSTQKLQRFLENWAENFDKNTLKVGITGYPNAGKSTLINMLVRGEKEKVSKKAGTTKKISWRQNGRLHIMDTPGVIPTEDKNRILGLVSGKDPHKMRNVEEVAYGILEFLEKNHSQTLQKHYNIQGNTTEELFDKLGKKAGYLQKGGIIDEHRTAIKLVEDWQKGAITI